jgi:NAD(P)-dependent dehydrogenase (short-subunit alcohol dehydrogenase family)
MQLSGTQRTAVTLGTATIAAVVAARLWRMRHAYDFRGTSVVVTGGSRGLGLVLARELAREGAKLTLIARDANELHRAVDDIQRRSPMTTPLAVPADVRQRDQADRAIAEVVQHYGRIDVLINNAGIIQVGPVDHMKLSDYEDALNTHFWGPLYLIVAALPHMRRQKHGRIVNISSIGGKIAVPHLVPYSASKFALTGLSDGLRIELARDNIIVTTVCPGLMRTGSPMNAMFKGKRRQEYAWFAISDSLPLATIDATRAARQIIDACRHGDAELIVTVQARLAVLLRAAAPELFQEAMTVINSLLPGPAMSNGDEPRPGRENPSTWAPSKMTSLSDRAARENNEL